MRPKVLIAGAIVMAFVVGAMANGIYSATTRAFNPVEEKSIASEVNRQAPVPASRTHFVQPKTVYVSNPAPATTARVSQKQKNRSFQKEALIVGGSAGAGAAIGAVAGGKKGAALGAVSGGVAGLVYDLVTRNK